MKGGWKERKERKTERKKERKNWAEATHQPLEWCYSFRCRFYSLSYALRCARWRPSVAFLLGFYRFSNDERDWRHIFVVFFFLLLLLPSFTQGSLRPRIPAPPYTNFFFSNIKYKQVGKFQWKFQHYKEKIPPEIVCVCLWRNVLWRSGDFDDRRRSFITQPQFLFDMEKIKESSAGWCVPVIFVCSCLLYIHMQVNTNQYSCWLILVCHFILILFFLARLSAAVYGFFGCCYRLQCLTFAAKIYVFFIWFFREAFDQFPTGRSRKLSVSLVNWSIRIPKSFSGKVLCYHLAPMKIRGWSNQTANCTGASGVCNCFIIVRATFNRKAVPQKSFHLMPNAISS